MLTKINIKFYFAFGLTLVIAFLTPHIIHGHVLISERYVESVILFLDLIIALTIYFIYKKEVKKISVEKKEIEETLIDSYKYIGKTNAQINLFNKFINLLSRENRKSKTKEKEVFKSLLATIMGSVIKTNKGLIRFIETKKGKTVKEFFYHKDGDQFVVKLSNKSIITNNLSDFLEEEKVCLMQSDYVNTGIICILCFPKNNNEDFDKELLKTLVNQIHLLFLATFFKNNYVKHGAIM